MAAQPLDSILPLLDTFDAFILDQWGVLHDGTRAFPEAQDAVGRLLDAGKVVVTLSNSGRRQTFSREQMRRMGLPVDRFRANVTSGEAAVEGLRRGAIGGRALPGQRCYLVCRDEDASVLDGTGIVRVATPDEADFVVLSGVEGEVRDLDDYLRELAPAIRRRLPVVCTNPDLVAVSPNGNILAPGGVARAYGERSGIVPHFVGKPHGDVYALCRRALPDVASSRIVAVGDSLDHDIKGAHEAGFQTVFCLDGIHADAFDLGRPVRDNLEALERLSEAHGGIEPDYVIDRLRWN